jgi:hypothetical protein
MLNQPADTLQQMSQPATSTANPSLIQAIARTIYSIQDLEVQRLKTPDDLFMTLIMMKQSSNQHKRTP